MSAMKFKSFVDRLLPLGTRRRYFSALTFNSIHTISHNGWHSFAKKVRSRFAPSSPPLAEPAPLPQFELNESMPEATGEMAKFERFLFKHSILPQRTPEEIKQSKLELITVIGKADSIRDLGGLWGVYGLYMIEGAKALNCKYAEMIDMTPLDEFGQKVRELEAEMDVEVKFIHADFRDPKLFESLVPVDVSVLYDVMLHQDNPEEVIKNTLSTTKQYVCLAQPVLKEDMFILPNGCVNVQFYPEELKDILRVSSWWPKEPVVNRFVNYYWMWGQTVSYFKSVFYGYGWDMEHLEVYNMSPYWNYALMRFVPRRGN